MNMQKPVKEIMSTKLITVKPESAMTEVEELFNQHNIHHIVVVDKGQKLVGIISKEDILRLHVQINKHSSGKTYAQKTMNGLMVKEVMTANPISLEADDTIGLAADIFLNNRFHALPITDGGEAIGIVTSHDLLAYAYSSQKIIR